MNGADTLVVGLGSIGQRHVGVLRSLGRRTVTVSRRGEGTYSTISNALRRNAIDYVVIATETAVHVDALSELAAIGFQGKVLVEKPLFASPAALDGLRPEQVFVGYNLRFHPVLKRLSELLHSARARAATGYVGQYLPEWRPGRDHRLTASARPGGGVVRDLSHEFDFLLSLFGPCRRLTAIVAKTAALGIETDDIAHVMMECERCPLVSVHLSYHDRVARRTLAVETGDHSYGVNFIAGTVDIDHRQERFAVDRDDTYRAMHRAVLSGEAGPCSAAEGRAVVDLIDAVERASAARAWVSL